MGAPTYLMRLSRLYIEFNNNKGFAFGKQFYIFRGQGQQEIIISVKLTIICGRDRYTKYNIILLYYCTILLI